MKSKAKNQFAIDMDQGGSMDMFRITLNDRKRFVISAAMGALLVLVAGGANALATTNTVWCVPNASISATCTPGKGKLHIQDAVYAPAQPGDVILVGPGYYNETVYVNVSNLSIFGAQAGKDARVDRHDTSKESIVDASPTPSLYGDGSGATFQVYGDSVVIDGFTIEGGTTGYAAGILVWGLDYSVGTSHRLVNNIIQNNAVGISLYYGVPSALIEYNLIKGNNQGTPSEWDYPAELPGVGIAAYEPQNTCTITENAFERNLAAAIFLYYSDGTAITGNSSEGDGSFLIDYGGSYTFFAHNQGRDFGAKGVWPYWSGYSADGAVDLIYYDDSAQINGNDLERGKAAGYNGIAFSNLYTVYYNCRYCQVSNNRISGFAGNGIVAESAPSQGTLYYSGISGNVVMDNGKGGILIESGEYNYYNTVFDNEAKGNRANDCEDDTKNGFTAETYNTWFNNIGSTSSPAGLCTARGWGH
jgi:hypothetical protein